MRSSISRSLKNSIRLLLIFTVLVVTLPAPPPADAGVMIVCNTMCSGGDCTVTAACSTFAPNTCAFLSESVAMANNAACTLGAVDGMAMAMGTMGTPATCSFFFANFCGATTMCTMGFFTTITGTCVVDAADGLPVELMDFSVDGNDSDASQGSSGKDE